MIPFRETITYPTKREVQKIIDSQVPLGSGYVSSQEGKDVAFLLMEMENGGPSNIGVVIFHFHDYVKAYHPGK